MAYSGLLTSRSDYSNFGGMLASMEENASQVTSENEQNNTFFDSLKIQTEAFGLQEAIPGLIESATSAYGLVGNVIKLGSSFGKLKAKLTDAGEQIKDLGGDALNQGKRLLGKTKDTLQSSYEEGSNLITTTSDDLLASGRQFVSTATEQVANLSDTVRNEANNLVSTVTDEAGNVLNTARQEASGVVQTAQSEGSGLLTAAQEQVGGLAESVQTQGRDALLNATRSTPEATSEPPAAPVTEADTEADFTNPTFYGGGQSVGETQQIFSNPLFDATSAPSVNEISDFSEIVANVNPRNLSSLVSSRINPASGGGDNLFQSSNMFDLGREAETTAYRMSAPYASAASNVTENLGGAASTAAENIGGAASTAAENAYASFSNLTASAGGAAENVGGAASAALETAGGAASSALQNVGGAASATLERLGGAASATLERLGGAASGALETAGGAASSTLAKISTATEDVSNVGKNLVSSAVDIGSDVAKTAGDLAAGFSDIAIPVLGEATLLGVGIYQAVKGFESLFSHPSQAAPIVVPQVANIAQSFQSGI